MSRRLTQRNGLHYLFMHSACMCQPGMPTLQRKPAQLRIQPLLVRFRATRFRRHHGGQRALLRGRYTSNLYCTAPSSRCTYQWRTPQRCHPSKMHSTKKQCCPAGTVGVHTIFPHLSARRTPYPTCTRHGKSLRRVRWKCIENSIKETVEGHNPTPSAQDTKRLR